MIGRLFFLAFVTSGFLFANFEQAAADDVGVILMHGKDGTTKSKSPLGKLKPKLGGIMVKMPTMTWSKSGEFTKNLNQVFGQIDGYVKSLRESGATKVVIGGHSIGANMALAYAANRGGVDGVLMIAPGHRPDTLGDANEAELQKAKGLIAKGSPGDKVKIVDRNQGKKINRKVRADVAIDYFAPDGLSVMQVNATKISAGIPVYWIIGDKDRLHPGGENLIFDKLPEHPKSAYVVISANHKSAPIKGAKKIKDWLKGL